MRLLIFFLFFVSQSVWSLQCQGDRVAVQVLGSGGPEMSDGRASTAYLIRLDGKGIGLIDVGSGSSINYEKTDAKLNDIEFFAFTHFHVDHSADFPAFIKAFYFSGRQSDIHVFGPTGNSYLPSAVDFVNRLFGMGGLYPYLSEYVEQGADSRFKIVAHDINVSERKKDKAHQGNGYTLSAVPVHHGPLPALAWRIDVAGCSITFSGDMSNHYQTLAELAKGSDILVAHHAIPEMNQGVARHLHMPPSEIGQIAAQSGVKQLILSHRMRRTLGKEKQALKSIRQHFQGSVYFADDLKKYSLNL